jgi:hypothetical protein
MAWSSRGSIAERLRGLRVDDGLLLKQGMNDPMGASLGQQSPMNTPGPQGMDGGGQAPVMPMTPESDYSAVGEVINQIVGSFDGQLDLIEMAEKAISQQAIAQVLPSELKSLSKDLHTLRGALMGLKYTTMGMHDRNGQVSLNEPRDTMTPMGNDRLRVGQGSVTLSPQGNESMFGGGEMQ